MLKSLIMAEGGDDSSLSTKCDDQRQQLHRERHHVRLNLGGMASCYTVVQGPAPVCGGLEDVGEEVKQACLNGDFGKDFMSTCKAVEERLFSLEITYTIFNQHELQQLQETVKQFREKQILISVVGHLNVGKSTLLNSLLGARLLPMKKKAATSVRVYIDHDAGDSCVDPKATSDQYPKLLLEGGKVHPEEVVGVTKIYNILEALNDEVRKGTEGHDEVFCTLKTTVPLLANAPPNWQVRLVDTPGTGDFKSRVAVAAKGALESSSAYVFVITYSELQSAENVKYIKFLHERDRGVFEDRRLIIVVTQFDRIIEPDSTDEEITVEKVQEEVCQLVHEACPDAKISFDDVVPLSGVWAYNARMLDMSRPHEPQHSTCREAVVRSLSNYQSSPCGQGESLSSSLSKQSDDQLVKQLLDISRIASLEARIHNVTTSCIKVWASKMKGDYERYLKQARDKLSAQSVSELKQHKKQKEEHSRVKECLDTIDEERNGLEEIMKSTLRTDLEKMYPEKDKASEALQRSKTLFLEEVGVFKEQCENKVNDKGVTFGEKELEADAMAFLTKMSKELEQISSSTGWCKQLNNVLTVRMTEMGASLEGIREKVQQLCATPGQKTAIEPSHTTEESTAEDSEEENCSEPPVASKGKSVNIPPVKVPWWSKLIETFRKVIQRMVHKSASQCHPPMASYRSWNSDLQATMDELEKILKEESDAYFANFKENILQSYIDQYCYELRARLRVFDGEFKPKIEEGRRQLQKLNESLKRTKRKMNELQQLCKHLKKLTSHLHTKADEYMH